MNLPTVFFCKNCFAIFFHIDKQFCPYCCNIASEFPNDISLLNIAHIDCDAFYATLEKSRNPSLKDKPVIIGGNARSVVSTACYIARQYGVRSAMPMYQARKLCPDAVILPPDIEYYKKISKKLHEKMLTLTPIVEKVSIDEAFLDLSGTENLHGSPPVFTLAKFAKFVEAEFSITISIGLSYCKFLAKIASDLQKPRGFSVIRKIDVENFLAEKDISILWGVGKSLQRKLNEDGIHTIKQLKNFEESFLIKRYGIIGKKLFSLARGHDKRKVEPNVPVKGYSFEITLPKDISDFKELQNILYHLCEKLSSKLKSENSGAKTIALKLKTKDFKNIIRQVSLEHETQMATTIFKMATPLLKQQCSGTKFRLIGIGVTKLIKSYKGDQLSLFDDDNKQISLEKALDKVREKFGTRIISKGYALNYLSNTSKKIEK